MESALLQIGLFYALETLLCTLTSNHDTKISQTHTIIQSLRYVIKAIITKMPKCGNCGMNKSGSAAVCKYDDYSPKYTQESVLESLKEDSEDEKKQKEKSKSNDSDDED